jgi:hypothetical protein
MGRSDERRRAVRIAACLVDLKECIRSEKVAEKEGKRPPMQPTGGRNRYVTLKPPKPRVRAEGGGAEGAEGGEEGGGAEAEAEGEAKEDALLAWMKRAKEPRIGPNFQATRLPAYAPRCVACVARRAFSSFRSGVCVLG